MPVLTTIQLPMIIECMAKRHPCVVETKAQTRIGIINGNMLQKKKQVGNIHYGEMTT